MTQNDIKKPWYPFYTSWIQGCQRMSEQEQNCYFGTILRYLCFDSLPDESNCSDAMLMLFDTIKYQLDGIKNDYINGCKGGRPANSYEEISSLYKSGKSAKEIQDETGIPLSTVYRNLKKAVRTELGPKEDPWAILEEDI